jgi:hypothetical protein
MNETLMQHSKITIATLENLFKIIYENVVCNITEMLTITETPSKQ